MNNNYVAIMAGGVGTRFWPASRSDKPKQFLDILGIGKSLLQMTFERACKLVPPENVLIVSNKNYKEIIHTQIPQLKTNQVLLEPSMNNTAPCVLYTALHLKAKNDNATFAVLPSDHMIMKEEVFVKNMNKGLEFAKNNDAIVTLGLEPTRPDTGYGYINFEHSENDMKKVLDFKEKPDAITAERYLDSGDYLWNAGIFIWSNKTIIKAYEKHASDIMATLSRDLSKYGSIYEQDYINEVYPLTRNISVDFAIIEKSNNVYTIPTDMSWSDLGTWNSLYAYMDKDKNDNVLQVSQSQMIDATGNLIRSSNKDKLIVAKGIKDYIIVDDGDVLLIYPRNEEQEIKEIRNNLDNPGIK